MTLTKREEQHMYWIIFQDLLINLNRRFDPDKTLDIINGLAYSLRCNQPLMLGSVIKASQSLPPEHAIAVALHRTGRGKQDIAKRIRRSRDTVSKYIKEHNASTIPYHTSNYTSEEADEVMKFLKRLEILKERL